MNDILTVDIAGYSTAVSITVENLYAASDLLKREELARAIKTVKSLRDMVASLTASARLHRDTARTQHWLLQEQKEALISRANMLYEQEQSILRKISDLKQVIAEQQANQEITHRREQDIRRQMDDLRTRLHQAQEHADELGRWFWVPGYNIYLAGRTIVEGDINTLNSFQQEFSKLAEVDNDLSRIMADLGISLSNLQRELAETSDREQEIKRIEAEVEKRKAECSAWLVIMMRIDDFFSSLLLQIEDIDNRVTEIQDIIDVIDGEIELADDEDGQKNIISMREALNRFGVMLDCGIGMKL